MPFASLRSVLVSAMVKSNSKLMTKSILSVQSAFHVFELEGPRFRCFVFAFDEETKVE